MPAPSPHAALIALLQTIPAQPIDTRTPLVILRPLIAGTLTFEEALAPAIQAALETCETIAYPRTTAGRSLCQRLISVRPIPAPDRVVGW